MSKIIIIGQIVMLIGIFSFIYFFMPSLNYPQNNQIIEKNIVDFKFRNANVILIDDNEDFSSPREINFNEINVSKVWFDNIVVAKKYIGPIQPIN